MKVLWERTQLSRALTFAARRLVRSIFFALLQPGEIPDAVAVSRDSCENDVEQRTLDFGGVHLQTIVS